MPRRMTTASDPLVFKPGKIIEEEEMTAPIFHPVSIISLATVHTISLLHLHD